MLINDFSCHLPELQPCICRANGSKIYNNESDEFLGNRWSYFTMMSSLVPLKSLSYNNNNNNNNNNNINQGNL